MSLSDPSRTVSSSSHRFTLAFPKFLEDYRCCLFDSQEFQLFKYLDDEKLCNLKRRKKVKKLKNRIESHLDRQENLAIFENEESFVEFAKREFGEELHNTQNSKIFDFFLLRKSLLQLLFGERLRKEHIKKMSPFEDLFLRTYLIKFGYETRTRQVDLTREKIASLLEVKCKCNSEKQMLAFALKAVFKKLMHPFSESNQGKDFQSDMSPLRLSREEQTQFYRFYFGHLLTETSRLDDYFFDEETLSDSARIVAYIAKISASDRIKRDIISFFSRKGNGVDVDNWDKSQFSIKGSELLRRHKYEIADKLSRRLTNYEIVLNQFDPKRDSDSLLLWMGIIFRDLHLYPQNWVCWNVFELEEAARLFLNYFMKPD